MRILDCPQSGIILQLKRMDVFQGLQDESLSWLASRTVMQEYGPQEVLLEEDSPADHFFILLRGKVKIVHRTPSGREHLIHVVVAKGLVGIVAMFRQKSHPATSVALDDCLVLRVSREAITRLVQDNADFALQLLGVFSLRLRMFVKKVSNHGVNAQRRVSRYILHRALIENTMQLELAISREEMANMLGIARETLSRVLSRLVEEQILSVQGRKIRILNLNLLRKTASPSKSGE